MVALRDTTVVTLLLHGNFMEPLHDYMINKHIFIDSIAFL